MADGATTGNAAASASAAAAAAAAAARGRGGRGCGLALGRLVRKLRRQSRMLCAATAGVRHAASSSSAARCHQYDALSYARNFDFGTALDGDDGYSFASRFVLAAPARRHPQ